LKLRILVILSVLYFGKNFSQNNSSNRVILDSLHNVVLMQPTGKIVNDLPEMTFLADTTAVSKTVTENIKSSFIKEFLDLYFIVQIYLKNNHKLDTIEPAYLALTENQGGFAKFGFTIKKVNDHIPKKNIAYVDITVNNATANLDRLMSFTQLYPHEMGHVFYHLLSSEDTISNNTKNVDMHFFSIVTDYSTAFNEGFAEHIENISRTYEKNKEIRLGVSSDIEKIAKISKQSINGFERDFIYPFRLGFYKASMLNWYQKYEDYKRHVYAFNGDIRYKNAVLPLSNSEDYLTYRNSGVRLNKNELRNIVQLNATEGAISSFFTLLTTSNLSNHYMEPDFYRPFLLNGSIRIESPQKMFSPLQNQFIKYFKVLHKYIVFNNSSKSQLIDFIDGYIQEFPTEENEIKNIFKKSLGIEYTNKLPPPLWLLVKDYPHRLLVFDPFDAITIPVYTFDLNAAETIDLLTIPTITEADAEKIIHYRQTNGYFTDFEQLKSIHGLQEEAVSAIISSKFDSDYIEENSKDFEPKLSIDALVISPLKYILYRAIIYFLILFGGIYFFFIKNKNPTVKQMVFLFCKYLLLWVLFVFVGLAAVFINEQSYLYVISLFMFCILLALLIFRKKKTKKRRTIVSICIMSLFILLSII
jgi:Helix-hairpin-helix motif